MQAKTGGDNKKGIKRRQKSKSIPSLKYKTKQEHFGKQNNQSKQKCRKYEENFSHKPSVKSTRSKPIASKNIFIDLYERVPVKKLNKDKIKAQLASDSKQ